MPRALPRIWPVMVSVRQDRAAVLCSRYNDDDGRVDLGVQLRVDGGGAGGTGARAGALRTRAGMVLAAASISGSFLGAKVSHSSLDVWASLALIAFVLCVGTAIWVLLPHKLVFAFRGQALLGTSDQEGIDDVVEAYRAVGIWIEPLLDSNRDKIADLSDWFAISCGLLALEVILWTVSLAS